MENLDMRNNVKLQILLNKATQHLREIFRKRWLRVNKKVWVDSVDSGKKIISCISKSVYNNFGKTQKECIRQGDCNEWDISTLTVVTLKLHSSNTLNVQEEIEKKNINKLKTWRNKIAHLPGATISDQKFEEYFQEIAPILISFGETNENMVRLMHSTEMAGIEFKSSVNPVSELNIAKANVLKELGNKACAEGRLSDAIKFYLQAIVLPGIPDRDLAILYSDRSTAYFKMFEIEKNECYSQSSLKDAEKVTELWPRWWNGHCRIGMVYELLGDIEKAIKAFDNALALDPTNEEVKNARSACRQKQGQQERCEHFDPRYLNIQEHWDNMHESSGNNLSSPAFQLRQNVSNYIAQQLDPNLSDVSTGHKYRDGNGVDRNYEMAAKYYGKAADKGNAQGIYELALLTKKGLGVKQDFKVAVSLLEKAASYPPKSELGYNGYTVGVAEAEHSLGLMHEEGVGVQKNFDIAVSWYNKAVEHGSPCAANNLGRFYLNGHGVIRDIGKAQQFFILSLWRRSRDAIIGLRDAFLRLHNPERALEWHYRAIRNEHNYAIYHREEFENDAKMSIDHFALTGVPDWEKANNLAVDGLSQDERQVRMHKKQCPEAAGFLAEQLELLKSMMVASWSVQTPSTKVYNYDLIILQEYAEKGSVTAKQLVQAITQFSEATVCLDTIDTIPQNITTQCQFLDKLASCYVIEPNVATMTTEMAKKSIKIVDFILNHCSTAREQMELTQLKANENAKICYAILHRDDIEPMIKFLSECIKKYPNNLFFYYLKCLLHNNLQQFEDSLKSANAGLMLRPSDPNFLYAKALAISKLHTEFNESLKTISAFGEFLDCAQSDHSQKPEAYYVIASCYIQLGNYAKVKYYYEKGLEAEKSQLPCFLPYDSKSKIIVKSIIDNVDINISTTSNGFSLDKEKTMRRSKLFYPLRKEIITRHREMIKKCREDVVTALTYNSEFFLKDRRDDISVVLKQMYFQDLDITKEHIYVGYFLDVTVIDIPNMKAATMQLVVEDSRQDIQRVALTNFNHQKDPSIVQMFDLGCKIRISNPHLRFAADYRPILHIDNEKYVVSLPSKINDICRCCGIGGDRFRRCSRCNVARYCSKECQEHDWKCFCHKDICVR